jgi:N-ethylmaleimide reductase
MSYAPGPQTELDQTPVPLDLDGIDVVIDHYRQAAENAADAGFDGVEMHCASGCLADQFLQDRTNDRADAYGGSIGNRSRFLVDAVQTLASVWGAARVGVRLSPFGIVNDISDSDPMCLFSRVLERLDGEGVAYVHLMEARAGAGVMKIDSVDTPKIAPTFRSRFSRTLIASGGFGSETANAAIADGVADAVSFGRHFLVYPDLPAKLRRGEALHAPVHAEAIEKVRKAT